MKSLEALPKRLQCNPFFHFCESGNFVPRWDKIRPSHVLPAFDYALEEAFERLESIIANPRPATFRNTIEALEQADELASYFAGVVFNVIPRSKEEGKRFDKACRNLSDDYNNYFRALFGSRALFDRVRAVRQSYDWSKMPRAQRLLMESYENGFKDFGIHLSPERREEFFALEKRIAKLEMTSQRNMMRAENETYLIFSSKAELDGLPDFAMKEARRKSKELGRGRKWVFTPDEDTYAVFMASVRNRKSRERLYRAYYSRASKGRYDNREIVAGLNRLYQKRARILGYRSVADMEMPCNMALKPGTVGKFLKLVRKISLPEAKAERRALAKYAEERYGQGDLKPWDYYFMSERMKKDLFGFDEEDLRVYFPLENVIEGMFAHFERLYGLRFKENKKYPLYHKDLRAFDVTNARSGKLLGVVFLDLFARAQKPAGVAWSASVMSRGLFMGGMATAVNVIVMKLSPPRGRTPVLLSHEDVRTLFHEMGHATHDLMSNIRYQSHAGTNVENDFLEFPSQIEEYWTFEPEVLREFAVHYQTGEPMPEEMMDNIRESRQFMAASQMIASARKGWLDLAWAETNVGRVRNIANFEKKVLKDFLWAPEHGEMLSPSFSHIFGGGYEMSYYGYQWAEALAADAYALFEQKGLYNREMASRMKKLKEQGASRDCSALYREFRRRCARMTSFFARLGLFINAPITMDMLYSPRRTAGAAPAAFHKRYMHGGRNRF